MRESLGDKIFLPGSDRDSPAVDHQRVTAVNHNYVFVIFVDVRRGFRNLVASPERHLAAVCAIKNVTLDAGSRLAAGRNLICTGFHELRKIAHRFSLQ
jgi:hypothetical protein